MLLSSNMPGKPELLAPAGDWECARAAAANGADAIYFGLSRFNARLRATNFTEEDLPRLMDYLHARGLRGYVTFNTLIFTDELTAAESQLRLLQQSRVDAAIVQDLGLARLARTVAPDVEVHASTQMTLTSPEGLRFAKRLGVERAVLARELSLREIAKLKGPDMPETEVFVHGALCVAYSGQCLTSEALGQRSANRGECAQACRLPYELVVDGVIKEMGDRRYLLSPQDLAAVHEIPELIRLGVRSFKIEGRLKSPEYVAAVSQVYRKAIDAAWETEKPAEITADDQYKLEMTFSRGLFSGWMHGVNHQELVHARFGKKRGAFVGYVGAVGRDHVELRAVPDFPLKAGDGLVFDTGGDTDHEQGGRLYAVDGRKLIFQRGKIDYARIAPGHRLWKTSDPQLNADLQRTFAKDPPQRRRRVNLRVTGRAGEPLILETGAISVSSSLPLQSAEKHPLTDDILREQMGRLGDTVYELDHLECLLDGGLMLPLSELNRLRRRWVKKLDEAEATVPLPAPSHEALRDSLAAIHRLREPDAKTETASPQLSVLCRSLEQVRVALTCGIETVYADFEDIRRYAEVVPQVREAATGAAILLATPRIQKAGEEGFFKLIENAAADGVLVRNLGALDYFRGSRLRRVGDFSLNVANPLTAQLLMEEQLEYLTVSYDLNADQVVALLQTAPPGWFEIVLHQHMPMFHMEHCVFAAFLSNGTDFTNCGRPCDRHAVAIRDRVGLDHPLKADVGCRNTVFHARAQSGADFLREFRAAGAGRYRVELLTEDSAKSELVIRTYQAALAGEIGSHQVVSRLKVASQLGVTNGTLTVLR
jgi:putative protease